jgi:hypothetical protein
MINITFNKDYMVAVEVGMAYEFVVYMDYNFQVDFAVELHMDFHQVVVDNP